MSNFIDIYVSGPVLSDLETFAQNFTNHIGPMPGVAATSADPTSDPPTPAGDAKGDPSLFYTCIRATFDITPLVHSPFAVVNGTTGASVVGVWA